MDNPVLANAQIGLAICAYATCSSTMLVINKLAVHFLPAPAIVLFFQLLSSAVAVFAADKAGLVKSEKLEWSKARTLANWLNCDAHRTPQRCCPAHPRCARLASGDTLTRHIEGGRRRTACSGGILHTGRYLDGPRCSGLGCTARVKPKPHPGWDGRLGLLPTGLSTYGLNTGVARRPQWTIPQSTAGSMQCAFNSPTMWHHPPPHRISSIARDAQRWRRGS